MIAVTNTARWIARASDLLVGRRVVAVRLMTGDEVNAYGWGYGGFVVVFDDGTVLWAQSDDEGNAAGALWVEGPRGSEVLPVICGG